MILAGVDGESTGIERPAPMDLLAKIKKGPVVIS